MSITMLQNFIFTQLAFLLHLWASIWARPLPAFQPPALAAYDRAFAGFPCVLSLPTPLLTVAR